VENEVALQARYEVLFQHLDERQRRLVAVADAEQLGHGGVSVVARTSGLSIHKGLRELRKSRWQGELAARAADAKSSRRPAPPFWSVWKN
jgi:hypothetical protein